MTGMTVPALPEESFQRVLCVVAHRDDMEYDTSAAVARWTGRGIEVGYLLLITKRFDNDKVYRLGRSMMRVSSCQPLTPSSRAAAITSGGKFCKPANRTRVMNDVVSQMSGMATENNTMLGLLSLQVATMSSTLVLAIPDQNRIVSRSKAPARARSAAMTARG
jgi:hypothetical protein